MKIIRLTIVLIIMLIGDIAFLMVVPSLIMGKLKALIQTAADWVESLFTAEADAYTNEEDIV